MKWCIILLLLFIYLTQIHACGWGGGEGGGTTEGTTESQKKGRPDPNPHTNFNGFEKPPGALDFNSFMATYNKSLEDRAKANGDFGRDKPADAGDDWPPSWNGIGLGVDGVPPPPWSYSPLNTGKAGFCLKPPVKGDCGNGSTSTEERWGFHPYTDECRPFAYSGCFGNQNNFRTKLRCEQACLSSPWQGCDLDSRIPKGQLKRGEHRRACSLTDQQLYEHTVRDYSNMGSL